MPRGRPRKDKSKVKVVELVPRKDQGEVIKPPSIEVEEYDATAPINRQVFADNSDPDDPTSLVPSKRPMTSEERRIAQDVVLEHFSATGRVDLACARAGVNFRSFYAWINRDEQFATRFEQCRQSVIRLVESRVMQIAMDDNNKGSLTACMAILNAEAPEKYRPRSTVDMNVRVMSDYKGFANRQGEVS
jgi:hypothetical protein